MRALPLWMSMALSGLWACGGALAPSDGGPVDAAFEFEATIGEADAGARETGPPPRGYCLYQICGGLSLCGVGKTCPVGDGCNTCSCAEVGDNVTTSTCTQNGCSCP